jgi:molybdopterin converting factor small subunit
MKLEVRLFAYLREGRDKKVYLDITEGVTTIQDVIDMLEIPAEHVSLCMPNGIDTQDLSTTFSEGDYLTIFPPVGGG